MIALKTQRGTDKITLTEDLEDLSQNQPQSLFVLLPEEEFKCLLVIGDVVFSTTMLAFDHNHSLRVSAYLTLR